MLSDRGVGLDVRGQLDVPIAFTTSVFAVSALAVITGALAPRPGEVPERVLFIAAIALLVMEPLWIAVGAAFIVAGTAAAAGLRRGRGRGRGRRRLPAAAPRPRRHPLRAPPGRRAPGRRAPGTTSTGTTGTAQRRCCLEPGDSERGEPLT